MDASIDNHTREFLTRLFIDAKLDQRAYIEAEWKAGRYSLDSLLRATGVKKDRGLLIRRLLAGTALLAAASYFVAPALWDKLRSSVTSEFSSSPAVHFAAGDTACTTHATSYNEVEVGAHLCGKVSSIEQEGRLVYVTFERDGKPEVIPFICDKGNCADSLSRS
jgi:hypothetical protein